MGGVGQDGSRTTTRKRQLTSNQETNTGGFAKMDIHMATEPKENHQ